LGRWLLSHVPLVRFRAKSAMPRWLAMRAGPAARGVVVLVTALFALIVGRNLSFRDNLRAFHRRRKPAV
jgi:hypothetical protein